MIIHYLLHFSIIKSYVLKITINAFSFITRFIEERVGRRTISQSPNNVFYMWLEQTGILFPLPVYGWISLFKLYWRYLALRNRCCWRMRLKLTEELYSMSSGCTDRNWRTKSTFCRFTSCNGADCNSYFSWGHTWSFFFWRKFLWELFSKRVELYHRAWL